MSHDAEEVDLGSAGLDWVKASLDNGLSLAHDVLTRQDLPNGKAVVYLAAGSQSQLDKNSLQEGGIPHSGTSRLATIQKLLGIAPSRGALLIVEDDLAKPSDPGRDLELDELLVFEEEIYHYMRLDSRQPEEVRSFLAGSASGYPLNGFVVPTEVGDACLSTSALNRAQISLLAEHTCAVVVAAFDDESYVIWIPVDVSKS